MSGRSAWSDTGPALTKSKAPALSAAPCGTSEPRTEKYLSAEKGFLEVSKTESVCEEKHTVN